MSEYAVEVSGATKIYGDVYALKDVSLQILPGEFFGILGPNGAGKTTLLEVVEGLRPLDSGNIAVLGNNQAGMDRRLRSEIGVQTQSSAFFPRLTALEHLETVAALYGCPTRNARDALARVGLTEKSDERVEKLSGGQRQRLAISSALVHGPKLIFLDEPTAALDPEGRRELWDVLNILREDGSTIIYTTHHLDEAEALCDRVAVLMNGQVLALDTPRTLLSNSSATSVVYVPDDGRVSAGQLNDTEVAGQVEVVDGHIRIQTDRVNEVMQLLSTTAGGLKDVQTRSATLEDVYLELIEKGNNA